MNRARREKLKALAEQAETVSSVLSDLRDLIEEVADEELNAFDNLPESLQYSERGHAMEEYAGRLQEAVDQIGDGHSMAFETYEILTEVADNEA